MITHNQELIRGADTFVQDDPQALDSLQTNYTEQLNPSWGQNPDAPAFGSEGEIKVTLADGSMPEGVGYLSLKSHLPGGIVAERYKQDAEGQDAYVESVFIPYAQIKMIKYVCSHLQAVDAARKEAAATSTSPLSSSKSH